MGTSLEHMWKRHIHTTNGKGERKSCWSLLIWLIALPQSVAQTTYHLFILQPQMTMQH